MTKQEAAQRLEVIKELVWALDDLDAIDVLDCEAMALYEVLTPDTRETL